MDRTKDSRVSDGRREERRRAMECNLIRLVLGGGIFNLSIKRLSRVHDP